MDTHELIAIILGFVYIATWAGAYKRGYDNGWRDAKKRTTMIARIVDEYKDFPSDPPHSSR